MRPRWVADTGKTGGGGAWPQSELALELVALDSDFGVLELDELSELDDFDSDELDELSELELPDEPPLEELERLSFL